MKLTDGVFLALSCAPALVQACGDGHNSPRVWSQEDLDHLEDKWGVDVSSPSIFFPLPSTGVFAEIPQVYIPRVWPACQGIPSSARVPQNLYIYGDKKPVSEEAHRVFEKIMRGGRAVINGNYIGTLQRTGFGYYVHALCRYLSAHLTIHA